MTAVQEILGDAVDARCLTPEEQYAMACQGNLDVWVHACGGKEVPFTVKGRTLLYCYNPKQGRHAYVDCGTDMVLTDDEAWELLG